MEIAPRVVALLQRCIIDRQDNSAAQELVEILTPLVRFYSYLPATQQGVFASYFLGWMYVGRRDARLLRALVDCPPTAQEGVLHGYLRRMVSSARGDYFKRPLGDTNVDSFSEAIQLLRCGFESSDVDELSAEIEIELAKMGIRDRVVFRLKHCKVFHPIPDDELSWLADLARRGLADLRKELDLQFHENLKSAFPFSSAYIGELIGCSDRLIDKLASRAKLSLITTLRGNR